MSGTAEADAFLLGTRGAGRELGAWVVDAAFGRDGRGVAFALGDGALHVADPAAPRADWVRVAAHDGGCLAMVADARDGFLSGGDDGRLVRTARDGAAERLREFGAAKWVGALAVHPSGLRAAAVGREVHLLDGGGEALKVLRHPSTVGGVAIDARGKRVAASHYGGCSLWFAASKEDRPRLLEWKGSHHAVAIAPDGDHVVSAMQESALHGWRLTDGQDMRMTGYPAKTRSLSFTARGRWLATSGSESIVLWPFTGGGPMGKAPQELSGGDGVLCTVLACHPRHEVVAAGFGDGLVLLAEIASGKVVPVAAPGHGAVSAVAWSPDGGHLAFGTETGFAALVDLTRR